MCIRINNIICETSNFSVVTIDKPHIDRMDGGQIIIISKISEYKIITDLPIDSATELIKLVMLVGEAMKKALNNNGVDIELINYQINGNWSANKVERDPMHVHLYGRSKSAIHQKFGEALNLPLPNTGFYEGFLGLSHQDIEDIRQVIKEKIIEGKCQIDIKFH